MFYAKQKSNVNDFTGTQKQYGIAKVIFHLLIHLNFIHMNRIHFYFYTKLTKMQFLSKFQKLYSKAKKDNR